VIDTVEHAVSTAKKVYRTVEPILKKSWQTEGKQSETVVASIVAPDGAPVGPEFGWGFMQRREAILQCFRSNFLDGGRNRLQVVV
jgi:hypothetical protein